MNSTISDILSVTISVIGIIAAIIAFSYSMVLKKKASSIKLITNRQSTMKYMDNLLLESLNQLDILGVSLHGLFRTPETLKRCISANPSLKIRILILNPYSISAYKYSQQEENLSTFADYINSPLFYHLNETIAIVQKEFQMNGQLIVKLYNDFPTGIMVINDYKCLFDPYSFPTSRRIGSTTPIMLISKSTDEGKALIQQILYSFECKWNSALNIYDNLKESSMDELNSFSKYINSHDK
jgi:hypothetical protein